MYTLNNLEIQINIINLFKFKEKTNTSSKSNIRIWYNYKHLFFNSFTCLNTCGIKQKLVLLEITPFNLRYTSIHLSEKGISCGAIYLHYCVLEDCILT